MLKQVCNQCGEELLGEVNRCWRCGREVAPLIVAEVRPAKPPLALAVAVAEGSEGEATAAAVLPEEAPESAAETKVRPAKPALPIDTVMSGVAAVLAVLVATASTYVAAFSHWGLALASLGIVLAAWGTFSRLRGLALLAILLCAIGVGIACFNLAIDVYRVRTGVHPFSPNTPVE